MSRSYIAEKLWVAVDTIDGDPDGMSLRDRLTYAMTGALIRLDLDDFTDPAAREAFRSIRERLTAFQAIGDEGDVSASAQLLPADEAEQLAADIRTLQAKYPLDT